MELVNLTPFAAERLILMNGDGFEVLLVVVKATYGLGTGTPAIADVQEPVVMADEYMGEPGVSSLRRAAEISLGKPTADVAVTGAAHSRRDRRTEALVVLDIGPVRKAVAVHGDRVWEGLLWDSPSAPRPFESIPLVYERAFGGLDKTCEPVEAWPSNPVGRGFRGKDSKLPVAGASLPNIEDVYEPMKNPSDRPPSRCLGPIGPSWHPRPQLAGTYDAHWQRERMPFPPVDFDARFEHPVPPDQVLPGYIMGGEQLTLGGVRPDGGGYRFALPAFHPKVVARVGIERLTPKVHCDTVIVDSEAETLCLVSRAVLNVQGRVSDLQWVKVEEEGHA